MATITSSILNSTAATYLRSFSMPAGLKPSSSDDVGATSSSHLDDDTSRSPDPSKNNKFIVPVATLALGKFEIDLPINFLENVRIAVSTSMETFAKDHFKAIGDSFDAFGAPANVVDYIKKDNGANMVFAAKVITFLVLAAFQNLYLATAGVALTYIHAIEQFEKGQYGECVMSLVLAHVMTIATPLFSVMFIASMGLTLAKESEVMQADQQQQVN